MAHKCPCGTVVRRQQAGDILEHECGRLKCVKEPRYLSKQVPARRLQAVMVPQRRVVLARGASEENVARDVGYSQLSDVRFNDVMAEIASVGLDGPMFVVGGPHDAGTAALLGAKIHSPTAGK